MPIAFAAEAWLGAVAFGVVALYTAIFAGRAAHGASRWALLILATLLEGVAMVSWFLVVWFLAKVFIALGLGAAPALVVAIVCGLVLIVPAVAACLLIVKGSYAAIGHRASFDSDLRNSLWLGRAHTFRPSDL